jgi:integrase
VGTVRKRAWKGQAVYYVDYIAASGERIRQTIGPGEEGRRLARKVLAQREAEAQLGIHRLPATRTPTFGEFAADWLERQQARRLAPKTADLYRGIVSHHLTPAFGTMHLGSITRADVEHFLAQQSHLSASTVGQFLKRLKAIFADAVEHGQLAENVAAKVKLPVRPDRHAEMAILTPEQFDRLLDVAGAPWRTLYLVAVRTGLRRGEILGLKWSDVNLGERYLDVRRSLGRVRDGEHYVVRADPLKTKKSRRRVGLTADVAEALLAHPAGDDPTMDYVFRSRRGGPIDPDDVWPAFHKHLTLAHLPEIPFHSLRHTFASFAIAAGVGVKTLQVMLGHASSQITLDRYAHLLPTSLEDATARLDAFIQGKLKATAATGAREESAKPAS